MVKPLLIFKGTRISDRESKSYDNRVVVKFQENDWCDMEIILFYVKNMWNADNTFASEKRSRLLVYDEYRQKITDKVKSAIGNGDTTILMFPYQ